jgi:hypothetical protein
MSSTVAEKVLGYFDIKVPFTQFFVRLNITDRLEHLLNVTADTAIITEARRTDMSKNADDTEAKCCAWKTSGTLYIAPQYNWTLPCGGDRGFKMDTSIILKAGDKIVFYANKVKYFAICELWSHGGLKMNANLIVKFATMTSTANTGLLDVLGELQLAKMVTTPGKLIELGEPGSVDVKPVDVKPVDVKPEPTPEPIPPKPARTAVMFDLKITPVKYCGVECWEIPSTVNTRIKIELDAPVDSKWRICYLSNESVLTCMKPNWYSANSKFIYIPVYTSKFWMVDDENNVVDITVTKAFLA